jgi:hydroxymethylpyrimidine pyrophosphatase-like HAD family hydrolase
VKAAADYVSAPNYENGVAQAVDIILEKGRLP